MLALYSFAFGWQSLADSCCRKKKKKSNKVSNLCLETASWITSSCERYRLRRGYLRKINAKVKKNEARDFIRQGAEPEKKNVGEVEDYDDLMI